MSNPNMPIEKELIKARTSLLMQNTFFGYLSLRLRMKESKEVPTCATDGLFFYWNRNFLNFLKKNHRSEYQKYLKTIIAHEVLHCALLHHLRLENRNPILWNIACDLAENQALKEAGFIFPPGTLQVSEGHKGKNAEYIYNDLIKNSKKVKIKEVMGMQRIGDMVKGARGKKSGENKGENKQWKQIENASDTEQEQIWKQTVKVAAAQAKSAGNFPSGLDWIIDSLEPPKLNWREILRRFVEEVAKDDYSWIYPNRRYISQGMYLPSLKSESLGDLAFFMDMSGSMSDQKIKDCLSEIQGVLSEFSFQNIYVLYFDTQVHNVDHFEETDFSPDFKPKGRGGTDVNPCFEWLKNNNIDPSCIIVMSDMGFYNDVQITEKPSLWITTTGKEGPYGMTIDLRDKK